MVIKRDLKNHSLIHASSLVSGKCHYAPNSNMIIGAWIMKKKATIMIIGAWTMPKTSFCSVHLINDNVFRFGSYLMSMTSRNNFNKKIKFQSWCHGNYSSLRQVSQHYLLPGDQSEPLTNAVQTEYCKELPPT